MKLTIALLILLAFSFCSNKKSRIESDLVAKSVIKGVFEIPRDSTGKRVYLIELKLVNKSDSLIEFLTQSCTTGSNLIFDSKEIIHVVNNCTGNSIGPIFLKPKQEFSFVFMVTAKKYFPDFLKVGWIFLTRENTGSVDNYFIVLNTSREKLENIIWSAPIELSCCGGFSYEIR